MMAAGLSGAVMADEPNRPLNNQQPDIFDEGGNSSMFEPDKLCIQAAKVDNFDEGGCEPWE